MFHVAADSADFGETLKPKSGERCLFYSWPIVNGTFMLMNLIDHYGFGWQKAPKTIRVPLLRMNFGSNGMQCSRKPTPHQCRRRVFSMPFGVVIGM